MTPVRPSPETQCVHLPAISLSSAGAGHEPAPARGMSRPRWSTGQEPTGNPIEYAEVIMLRFENGKIVEHRAVADTAGLMAAISGESPAH
jgi:hypothetical protein